ncbi:MAG: hypothetical protein AAFY27_09585, partial [Pseudomonadota bacterium]
MLHDPLPRFRATPAQQRTICIEVAVFPIAQRSPLGGSVGCSQGGVRVGTLPEHLVRAGKLLERDGITVNIYGYGDMEPEYRRIIAAEKITNV